MDNQTLHFKELLQSIKSNNYVIPENTNIKDLTQKMMENIGSTDPELRDDLIYTVFARIVMRTEIFTKLLPELSQILLDKNHLFFKIGETGTDSVFTRSFSALFLPPIIISHRNNNFLSKEEVLNIYTKLSEYYLLEKDLRGYVPEKGWAHAVAHSSDALDDIALCHELGHDELLRILNIISKRFCINSYVFIDAEDERIVTAITSILSRNLLSHEEIKEWIRGFSSITKSGLYLDDSHLKINIKNLLRSLYFRIIDEEDKKGLISEIKTTLSLLNEHIK